jgi:DNA-binding transcriptional LysR family regulator
MNLHQLKIFESVARHLNITKASHNLKGAVPNSPRRQATKHDLRELLRQGYKPNIAVQCDVSEAVKAAVQRELGVGILYRETVEADLKTRDLKILDVPDLAKIKLNHSLSTISVKPLSGVAQDFLHALRESRISKVESAGLRKITA